MKYEKAKFTTKKQKWYRAPKSVETINNYSKKRIHTQKQW